MMRDTEHRRYPRKAASFRADYARGPDEDEIGYAAWGVVRNISVGGMFIEHSPDIRLGEIITTAFVLPTGEPFRLTARVVHADEKGSGLQFLNPLEVGAAKVRTLRVYCTASSL